MREMPKDERPYEKCARLGADSLSDVELLAVLLRTGTQGENAVDLARRVLYHAGENGILGIHQFNVERLKKNQGNRSGKSNSDILYIGTCKKAFQSFI